MRAVLRSLDCTLGLRSIGSLIERAIDSSDVQSSCVSAQIRILVIRALMAVWEVMP